MISARLDSSVGHLYPRFAQGIQHNPFSLGEFTFVLDENGHTLRQWLSLNVVQDRSMGFPSSGFEGAFQLSGEHLAFITGRVGPEVGRCAGDRAQSLAQSRLL